MRAIYNAGSDPDLVTIAAELEKRGKLAEVGGPAKLTGYIVNGEINSLNTAGYANIIADRAARRRMVKVARDLMQSAMTGGDINTASSNAALELTHVGGSDYQSKPWGEYLDQADEFIQERAAHPGETWGIPSGLADLDSMTGGFQAGELAVISGEPGIGKSFLILQMTIEMAKHSPGVVYSLEMMGRAVGIRALSMQSKINAKVMRTGRMEGEDWDAYYKALEELHSLPVYMSDREGWTLAALRSDLVRQSTQNGCKWFMLDYSYMLADGAELSDNERSMVISSGVKRICKATNMAGQMIHSMNKAGLGDQKGGGTQAGLRGSAQVSYDADLIIFLAAGGFDGLVTGYIKKGREIEGSKKFFELRRVGAKFYPLVRPKV
jgi:replicative DNA helicase